MLTRLLEEFKDSLPLIISVLTEVTGTMLCIYVILSIESVARSLA
jgi:hypothetical protein